ncbi:MAG: hypothetical protein B6244_11530 [Candidatus Cloacimonetes bacterium 4572_55]|nr:MAG: hypothetical protein B6244_11530 [Candidatus Cloacimonetes bacterium 4572_55]
MKQKILFLMLAFILFCFSKPAPILAQTPPPNNLTAEFDDYTHTVLLTWSPPEIEEGEWIHWDGESNASFSIGVGTGGTFSAAARFTSEDLSEYIGAQLTELRFMSYSGDGTVFTTKIWEGGSLGDPGTVVYESDPIIDAGFGFWYEVELSEPITIAADQEYWMGYDVTHSPGDNPAGADDGPMIQDKGGWITFDNGTTWDQLSSYGADYNRNWNIQGKAVSSDGSTRFISASNVRLSDIARRDLIKTSFNPLSLVSNELPPVDLREDSEINLRETLIGYRLYRSLTTQFDQPYIEINDPETDAVLDENAESGETYYYVITAVYEEGESEYSNTASVDIPAVGQVEIAYDDGSASVGLSYGEPGTGMCVEFTSPTVNLIVLRRAMIFMRAYPDGEEQFMPFELHLYDAPDSIDYPGADNVPPIQIIPPSDMPPNTWMEIELPTGEDEILISGHNTFFMGIVEQEYGNYIGHDQTPPHHSRSWIWDNSEWFNLDDFNYGQYIGDLMIRVFAEEALTVEEIELTLGSEFDLRQNYPNPFIPGLHNATAIEYALAQPANVWVSIYNSVGQSVKVLEDRPILSGLHQMMWDGRDQNGSPVGSGVYFYTLRLGERTEKTRRLILIKN